MRVAAFVTQCGSLLLVQAIMLRVTGSRVAAVVAPIVWVTNSKLTVAMISNGAYVHVLCAFLMMLALYAAICQRWKWMWTAFLVGFGALESMVVFPALATAWCWLYDRANLRRVLWLWPVSVAYYVAHMFWAPKMSGGSYRMQFDLSIFQTLAQYWLWIFEPQNVTAFTGLPLWLTAVNAALGTVLLLGLTVWGARKKQWRPVLFCAWFVVLLAPVLPLRGHVTDYYLTIPLAAFGMLAGYAVTQWRWPVILWLALYFVLTIPCAHRGAEWWRARSVIAERLVKRVFAVHQANPEATILLQGVNDEQFWAAIAHYPFVERRKTYVFLERGSEGRITAHPESGVRMEEFFLTGEEERRLRESGRLVDFRVDRF
jgi:hypothetical protein